MREGPDLTAIARLSSNPPLAGRCMEMRSKFVYTFGCIPMAYGEIAGKSGLYSDFLDCAFTYGSKFKQLGKPAAGMR
jgi:hypothetical protein